MSLLLRVQTAYVVVDLLGPELPPPAVIAQQGDIPRPHLALHSSDAVPPEVSIGSQADPVSVGGPLLFEEASYTLIARSLVPASMPVIQQRDPGLVGSTEVIAASGIVTAHFVYQRQVGLSEWRVRVGDETLSIIVEVFPTKLDYETDYVELIDDIGAVQRVLILEYLRSTYRVGGKDPRQSGHTIDWVTMLRNEMNRLKQALHWINDSPRRSLRHERQLTPLHAVRAATSGVSTAINRGSGIGQLIDVEGLGKVHERIPADRSIESLDTFEHRWIGSRLRQVHRQLLELQSAQRERIEGAAKWARAEPTRLAAELVEIDAMVMGVAQLVDLPFIKAASVDAPASLTSLQLQSAIGYSDAYRILTSLTAALVLLGNTQTFSLSDVNDLFETWCFLKVVQLACDLTDAEIDLSEAIAIHDTGLRFSLRKGAGQSITLSWPGGSSVFQYNPSFNMPTGTQVPDIVVRVRHGHNEEVTYVLDAKYRIDASDRYVEQFGSPGPPIKAVNELHRYRDAIQPIVDGERRRMVAACAALFPWSWPLGKAAFRLHRSLDEVGVGALPFLPSNVADVSGWLAGILGVAPSSSIN